LQQQSCCGLFGEDAQDGEPHRVTQRAHHIGEFLVVHPVHRQIPIEEAAGSRKVRSVDLKRHER